MDKPLEIAFHGVQPLAQIESEIRDQIDKLERRFGHLIGCRVAVELLHRQHKSGNICDIHIEMQVPGGELVVSRQNTEAPAPGDGARAVRIAWRPEQAFTIPSGEEP